MAFPRVSFRKEIGGIERSMGICGNGSCIAGRDNDVCFFRGESRWTHAIAYLYTVDAIGLRALKEAATSKRRSTHFPPVSPDAIKRTQFDKTWSKGIIP